MFHSRNVDALIRAAALCPTVTIRDALIDLEIDYHGNAIGFDAANALWHRLIPDPVIAEHGAQSRPTIHQAAP